MEKNNLYQLLIEGESFKNSSIDELREIVDKYPYFQTARLLYTKKLLSSDDEDYDEELSKTAILCADRRKLFYFIQPEKYESLLNITESNQPEEKDRTEALLNSYFKSFGSEEDNTSPVDTKGISYASTDYFSYLESLGVDNTADSSSETFEHQDIIDAFINNESEPIRLRPLKASHDTEKVEDENEFLTETLAKIYIKQKKYEQALTIIKRLSLTFPKKSSYFADQIRFLEYLIINEKKIK